jgi:charged multivesicular body protein 5
MGMETEADGVPSYLQPDKEHDLDSELSLPSAPIGQAAAPAGRSNAQVKFIDFFFFPEKKRNKLMLLY